MGDASSSQASTFSQVWALVPQSPFLQLLNPNNPNLLNLFWGRRYVGSRLSIYCWPPLYTSWGDKKDGLQFRHVQLASCLHFLRQEMGGLQVQSASCLLSEMKVTETGLIVRLCLLRTLEDNSYGKPCLSKRIKRSHILPPWGKGDTTQA